MTHADQRDLFHRLVGGLGPAAIPSLVVEAGDQFVEVRARSDTVDRHDLDHTAVLFAIEDGGHLELLDLKSIKKQFFQLVAGFRNRRRSWLTL